MMAGADKSCNENLSENPDWGKSSENTDSFFPLQALYKAWKSYFLRLNLHESPSQYGLYMQKANIYLRQGVFRWLTSCGKAMTADITGWSLSLGSSSAIWSAQTTVFSLWSSCSNSWKSSSMSPFANPAFFKATYCFLRTGSEALRILQGKQKNLSNMCIHIFHRLM